MQTLFLEAKSKIDITDAVVSSLKFLPKRVGIISTSQHMHSLKLAKDILKKHKKTAVIAGQVLGCNAKNAKRIANKVDAFLFIGSGEFHPIRIQLETKLPVILADPFSGNARKLNNQEVEKVERQQKGALLKFLASKNIGIIVSAKPGQNKLKQAFELKAKLKDKKSYIFIADTINESEFENFPFIECWVNTACPRFADEKTGVVNYETIQEII